MRHVYAMTIILSVLALAWGIDRVLDQQKLIIEQLDTIIVQTQIEPVDATPCIETKMPRYGKGGG